MRRSHFGRKLFVFSIAAFFTLRIVSSVFAAGPTGAGPHDPLMVPTDWQNIVPTTTLWFYFDYAVDGSGLRSGPGFGPRSGSSVRSTVTLRSR